MFDPEEPRKVRVMKCYLATIDTNWADEMDLDGHVAMDQKEYDSWQKSLKKVKFPVTVSVGTNEEVIISKKDIKVKEITKDDYEILNKLGLKSRGFTNCIELDCCNNEDDEVEEDADSE